jgi:hypothetical protein
MHFGVDNFFHNEFSSLGTPWRGVLAETARCVLDCLLNRIL